jgi:hypothetical protein
MCTLIGLMTVSWAWAETTLAMTIGIVEQYTGPITGHPQSPVSLKRKVACFKVILRDVQALHPFQEEGSILAKRFIELAVRRNQLVHGAAWETEHGRFQSMSLPVIAGKYAGKDHSFDIRDAYALNVEIGKLSDDMTAFMLRVAHAVSGEG